MKNIYIEKLAEVPGGLPARNMDEHIMGKPNDNYSSIPIEYNLDGVLSYDIEVGKPVVVGRTKRNGVDAYGVFTTSTVTEIGDNYFKTRNSVYSYKLL